jgi:hypothetical protein
LGLEKDDPEKMASIKPQQPQRPTVVYPAVRKLKPGYSKVYTRRLKRVWKIAAFTDLHP